MATCKKCDTETNIVHSGVDALLLGVMEDIYKICYACANAKEEKTEE